MLLPPGWKDKCGLKMVTANDGTTEWVRPCDEDKFKSRGAGMIGGAEMIGKPREAAAEFKAPVRRASAKMATEVISRFLKEECEVSSSLCTEYAAALATEGYDSLKNLQLLLKLPEADWPAGIKVGASIKYQVSSIKLQKRPQKGEDKFRPG